MTASIQPPALAWAWQLSVGDPAAVTAIAEHYDWLRANRDLDGDGLIWIVQPDESGLDASPQFDPIWGAGAHGLPGFALLVRRNRRLGYDLRAVIDAGGPVCCEVVTNVLYALSLIALGRPSTTSAIVSRLYDERAGAFRPIARPTPRRTLPLTWTALAPLALPDLPESIGRRLVEDHLLNRDEFWLPVAPPSVAAAEPSFSVNDRGPFWVKRYWRGPTWVNAAWLVWLGLVRLGYAEQARVLGEGIGAAINAAGLREYYNPYTGTGMGAREFGWSALAIELLEPAPVASR
jgi:hypothetical protein